jgi:acetate kinase
MDAILVVNAGSSSVKFQIFGIEAGAPRRRLIRGQLDGIGIRPRLSAEASDKSSLIDKSYAPGEVADVPAAMATVASWLRETQNVNLLAVGHRVVHGGPKYTSRSSSTKRWWPISNDTCRLHRCISRTIWRRSAHC